MKNSISWWPFKVLIILCSLALVWLVGSLLNAPPAHKASVEVATAPPNEAVSPPKRILFVHSYHKEYPWTAGILAGAVKTLGLSQRREPNFWGNRDIVLQNFFMDTKRKAEEASKQAAARQAEELIKSWKPDIVLASDDNAVKYVVVPMLAQSDLPVVFCGINWDAREYKMPNSRVTGMIEVQPIDQILAFLKPFARGANVGFLKGADLSAVKEADAFETFTGVSLNRRLVTNLEEWMIAYRELQEDCDVLLIGNSASIHDWDEAAAKQLVATATRIPTGTWDAWMREYSLVTFSTVPEEQGEWVATAALAILGGKHPEEIPVTQNHKVKIHRNMAIAKQLGIVFPMDFIRRSWAVEQKGQM